MEVIYERCCGIDVHKKAITACIMISEGNRIIKEEIRTFSTMTEDIEQLRDWLKLEGITHVAIESTGNYWKPIYNVFEGGFEVILANSRHVKNVPGRKTDPEDSRWLCKLLRSGLIRGSFIPPRHIRQLRDLTRYRSKLNNNITAEKNRLQKYLEDANIKLSSVVTDIFGVSGREMLKGIIEGKRDVEELSGLARGRLRDKKDELKKSLNGRIREHHRMLMDMSIRHIEYMEGLISKLDSQIAGLKEEDILREKEGSDLNLKEATELLDTIPGVNEVAANAIISEIGTDMSKFPTDGHISSWAGMSPGNNESAGKKKVCRTTQGNRFLKAMLTECAWAATRKRDTYLQSKYNSLVGRRGKKKALIAVGHKILIMCYQILKNKVEYKELGANYLDSKRKERIVRSYVKRLSNLGYKVLLEEAA